MDVYYVPSSDYHGSEYLNDYFKFREYLSGFTGSAGELLVAEDRAFMWTDGRYFLQAESELEGSGIELMRIGEEGTPKIEDFIADYAAELENQSPGRDFSVGFDARTCSSKFAFSLDEKFEEKGLNLRFKWDEELISKLWPKRPVLKGNEIWELPTEYAGVSAEDKIAAVRREMRGAGADYLLLSDLMEVAWLFNLRGSDILYTPVFFSFALLTQENVRLYVMEKAMSAEIMRGLRTKIKGLEIRGYADIYEDIAALKEGGGLWYDSESCNYYLYANMPDGMDLYDAKTPPAMMKIIKNDTEVACTKETHIKDGIALTKLIKWVKDEVGERTLGEVDVSNKARELRLEQEGCFDMSFETIAAYGANAAIVHYEPKAGEDAALKPEGFLLIDSGGQYMGGTTDVTRTIALGNLTQEMIDDYTLVLKSHVGVSMFKVKPGLTGKEFDDAAREPLRARELDFKHGISHGVGYVLGVHEGPNVIKREAEPIELKANMIMSNEPGVYIDGKFGIRIENLIRFKEDGEGNVINEPLTCVPYERRAINKELLSEDEIAWIDDYHAWVRETLTPLVDEETAVFIRKETEPL